MQVRDDFHKLIDGIADEQSLKSYFDFFQDLVHRQNGALWNRRSEAEKEDLSISLEESFHAENLISNEAMKRDIDHLRA